MSSRKRIILGALALFAMGSGFHFVYDLLGQSKLAAPFFAVNESVWEHMKLLSTAAVVWMVVEWFVLEKNLRLCFFAIRAAALPMALLSIPMIFYFYSGAFGFENIVIDMGIFLIASLIYQYAIVWLERRWVAYERYNIAGITVLVTILLLFAVFTFLPPHLPLFLDASSGLYGIAQ